ncbi:MAG: choice-of-anchor B family protein [Flavobacteriales bacterium]|nr:choice-of-anchor B family protein [Flavobacteriales bacterium]
MFLLIAAFALVNSVVLAQDSLNVRALFNWQDASLPASSTWSNTYNEVWGYAADGREYGVIGSTNGTHIIDVTDPTNSYEAVFIEGAATGSQVIHRHFDNYGHYLYMVCDEGPSTLQIADLSFLPDSAPLVYDSNVLFTRAHNCFIDQATAHLYVVGNSNWAAVYSLEDPTDPTLLVNCRYDLAFWNSIGYLHDIYVRNDTAYCNAETRGLFVVDFTDMENPTMIGSLPVYPHQGYNHSGYLMENQPYYAMADETHGKSIKILDVSDMQNLQVTDTVTSGVNPFSIPHNLIYRDNFLFVSYYYDGMYVFNCTDPAHPTLAGFYDTSTEPHADNDYRGCWGVYPFLPSGHILASDMQTGLWVLDGTDAISGTTGTDAVSEREPVLIRPNPVTDRAEVSSAFGGSGFSVMDMFGKERLAGTITTNGSIPQIESLNPGLYLMRIQDHAYFGSVRFIKH